MYTLELITIVSLVKFDFKLLASPPGSPTSPAFESSDLPRLQIDTQGEFVTLAIFSFYNKFKDAHSKYNETVFAYLLRRKISRKIFRT